MNLIADSFEWLLQHHERLLLNTNAIICAVTAFRLMTFSRGRAKHNRLMAFIAWLLTVAMGAVAIRVMTGEYFRADWSEVLINLLLCAAVLRTRGNVGHLLRGK